MTRTTRRLSPLHTKCECESLLSATDWPIRNFNQIMIKWIFVQQIDDRYLQINELLSTFKTNQIFKT